MIAALITACGTVVAALIAAGVQVAKLRRENTAQHADNKAVLERVEGKVDDLAGKVDTLDGKVDGHAEQLAFIEGHLGIGAGARR